MTPPIGGVRAGYISGQQDDIPDNVVSRPTGDSTSNTSDNRLMGLVINPNNTFSAVGARIAPNHQIASDNEATLWEYDASTSSFDKIDTSDITGKSSGNTFAFQTDIQEGTDYAIVVSTDSAENNSNATNYPYTGTEIDIVGRADDFNDGTPEKSQNEALGINDIGNPDNVLN